MDVHEFKEEKEGPRDDAGQAGDVSPVSDRAPWATALKAVGLTAGIVVGAGLVVWPPSRIRWVGP